MAGKIREDGFFSHCLILDGCPAESGVMAVCDLPEPFGYTIASHQATDWTGYTETSLWAEMVDVDRALMRATVNAAVPSDMSKFTVSIILH